MLVDSSVWIDFLKGTVSPETQVLKAALDRSSPLWTAPPILQEILQGADTPERFSRWDRALGELPLLADKEPRTLARDAAHLYTRCRWRGITLRSSNDCLIALYATRHELPLLHRDRDFPAIATVETRLKLFPLGATNP